MIRLSMILLTIASTCGLAHVARGASILDNAAMSDICGSTSGQELSRAIDSGLATVDEVMAAISVAEDKCPQVFDIDSSRLRIVLKSSFDLDKPISISRRVVWPYRDNNKGAWLYYTVPRIFALSSYYAHNEVDDGDTLPLKDSIDSWLKSGGNPNNRACDGTSLAEVLIAAEAPNSIGLLGAAGANFNVPTTVVRDSLAYGEQYIYSVGQKAATKGLVNINFHPYDVFAFGPVAPGPVPYRTNDCVTSSSLPQSNLTLFEFAFNRALERRSKFAHDSTYGLMLDNLLSNGATFDYRIIYVLAAHGAALTIYAGRGLEYLISKGFDINTKDPNGNTLASILYSNGADPDTVRYLVGLGAKLE